MEPKLLYVVRTCMNTCKAKLFIDNFYEKYHIFKHISPNDIKLLNR